MMLGDNLQPAALIQIYEDVICTTYYNKTQTPSFQTASTNTADPCKTQAVQKELALVRGSQLLAPVFAAVLCTIPYGLLSERIGRKRILILSGTGVFAALSWVLAVCHWQFVSIRWVWFSGVFLFIGGGDAVSSSVAHVMVTDVTDQAERAQIFMLIHAADVISGLFGPAISAALMAKGHAWWMLLLAWGTIFTGTFLVTLFIPETLYLREKYSSSKAPTSDSTPSLAAGQSSRRSVSSASPRPAKSLGTEIYNLLRPLFRVLASNKQAVLLLCLFAPQTAARELFTVIGLQYSSAKFSLSYARGNVLLSLFQGTQGLFALVLLPLITRLVAEPRGWSAWARDRLYAIISVAITALGLMVIALAPGLSVEAGGLLLVALGSCTTGLVMSLLGAVVKPGQVSAVFSVAPMLSVVTRSLVGPIVNALLVAGMELGREWTGLPFAIVGMLMGVMAIASGFIRAEGEQEHDEEED